MNVLRKLGGKLKDMSPSTVRELITIAVILCISIVICLPQYRSDIEAARIQKSRMGAATGLPVAKPEDKGMDSAALENAASRLKSTSALSFLVVRDGNLVYEKYYEYRGNSAQSRNNVYSVTKSFLSALIGIAEREGFIGSIDDPVEKYLPEYFTNLSDPRWKQITLKHLLTMTPGFCEDLDSMTSSRDWVIYTFALPLRFDPGERFQYANSSSHLLSVILTRATGMSTMDFATKYLFGPIEMDSPDWKTDPDGNYAGYANLYISPREMAKFGWLYYNKGKWNGKQVVPEEWVADSTRVHVDLNGTNGQVASGANSSKDTGENSMENGYGYQWWVSGKTGYHSYSALGYGGQSITVIPDLALEVVIICMPDAVSISDEQRDQLLKDFVIPAIKDGKQQQEYQSGVLGTD